MSRTNLEKAMDKIKNSLEWRGPNGRGLAHVVLTREEAIAVLNELQRHDIETYLKGPGGTGNEDEK